MGNDGQGGMGCVYVCVCVVGAHCAHAWANGTWEGRKVQGCTRQNVQLRPWCSSAHEEVLSILSRSQPPASLKKLTALPALCSVKRFLSNSTNSGDKYLTIILAFFTPKRIFSCGLTVAWTLAFWLIFYTICSPSTYPSSRSPSDDYFRVQIT